MTAWVFITRIIIALQPIEAFSAPQQQLQPQQRLFPASSSLYYSSALRAAASSPSSRINQKLDLDSLKEVATIDKLIENNGEDGSGGVNNCKKVYCRCWQSNTFPLCDGAHVAHNKVSGDNVGPLIVSVATTTKTLALDTKEKSSILFRRNNHNNNTDHHSTTSGATTAAGGGVLTAREKLAKMGLSALLSYGWVSNMSYAVTLSLSWYGFSKKTGMSPLSTGQWKPYLAVYAGFYVFNNFLRPFRLGLSVIVSNYFDSFVNFIQVKTKLSRKWSIGIVVFLANVCGTLLAMALGVWVASTASGVPIFPVVVPSK